MRLSAHRRKHRSRHDPCFVIQHEGADSDHYDLLLEIDGVLVSWTIPKDRRMARRADDHPLEWADNDVVIGDRGTYENVTRYDMSDCLERGSLAFRLHGENVRGCYSLTRIRDGADETWLLIKRKEDDADQRHRPVPTGRELDEPPEWS
jgi:DNA ligase D-like protein (predicted 3'-phosphoesterase)